MVAEPIARTRSIADGSARFLVPAALGATMVVLAVGATIAWMRWVQLTSLGFVGIDFDAYHTFGQQWLDTGSQYLPVQLLGPYDIYGAGPMDTVPSLYPPIALGLFVPFVFVPAVAWWLIPIAGTAILIARWRPVWWTWPILALMLAHPETTTSVMVGNTTMWGAAAVAGGIALGWPAAALLIKPTLLPFAIVAVRRRSFWISVGIVGILSLIAIDEWGRWVTAIDNASLSAEYSFGSYPALLIPVVAWIGRRRQRNGAVSRPIVV